MFELILVRHAKSDWSDPGLSDHDRPLNARGAANAPMMARRLADALGDQRVDRIISSTALRARRTAAEFGSALDVDVELERGLYMASADILFETALSRGGSSASTLLLVAHDPGMSVLAHRLSDGGIEHMPTCAVARFRWDDDVQAGQLPDHWSLETVR